MQRIGQWAISLIVLGLLSACAQQTPAAGPWLHVHAGEVLEVRLADLKPTQGGLGFDQVYYKLGHYEEVPASRFDDFCHDEGLGGLVQSSATSFLREASTYACKVHDLTQRDTSALNTVVVGPHGDSLYLTDGHHGLSTYYELADGGPALKVHVVVRDNLSVYTGATFWEKMQTGHYAWLKNGKGVAITPQQLPSALGLHHGLQDDPYRALVYFTRDIGYGKPARGLDYLEFFWADWLRPRLDLSGYVLSQLKQPPDPVADRSYAGAIWNAAVLMTSAQSPVIEGKSGMDLGQLAAVNRGFPAEAGAFRDLLRPDGDAKPGKLAGVLRYKARHAL